MGTIELTDYENLWMMLHSIEMFWNDFEGEYDLWRWHDFDSKLMVGFGCDTTPALPYNHNTWNG